MDMMEGKAQALCLYDDIPAIAAVSFSQAVRALEAMCLPNLEDALFGLKRLKAAVEAARIVTYYDPGDPLLKGGASLAIHQLFDEPAQYLPVEERALEVVRNLFPIHYTMEEQLLSLEPGDFRNNLYIAPQGTAWTIDDFDWFVSQPDETFRREVSALIFAKYLNALVDVEDYLKAAEYFGWPERLPLSLERHDVKYVAGEKLISMLEERNLEEFAWVFQVVFQTVDNPFFDLSDEDIYTGVVEYTLENVRQAAELWQEAQPVVEMIDHANYRALNEPEVLERVLDAWDECTLFEKKKRTLVEVFGEEEEERVRVIDPFYGPLDGGDDDWEEEAENGEE